MNNDREPCMGYCGYWEQHFYQDDPEAEYEKCYDWCNLKHRGITERHCTKCEQFKHRDDW